MNAKRARRTQNSGERTRLACWRWRPRQRELSQQRVCPGKMVESSLRFPKTELVAARRRDRHARRVRSPEADSAHLISILECIRALEARPRCPLPRLDVLAAANRKRGDRATRLFPTEQAREPKLCNALLT